MRKLFLILILAIILFLLFFIFFRGNEDSWIKDSRGVYIKHGNSSVIPDFVRQQQDAISCANELYNQKKIEGMEFNSQCLGTCGDFAVDVVHAPRNAEDNLEENQCEDYRNGKVNHFIELDKEGIIVRIV